MSRWLVWPLIGVASCCNLLAASGWAQTSPVAAVEYTASDGAILTPTAAAASRWSGRVQIDDQPQQVLTPDPRQPVVLQLESSVRQLSFYLQIPEPVGAQTGYRYQLSGWDTQWQPLPAGSTVIRYAALPAGHYRFQVQSGSADAVPSVLCEIWIAAGNWRSSWWVPLLAMLCVLLLWAGYHWRKVFSRPSQQSLLPLKQLHEQNQQLQQQLARQPRYLELAETLNQAFRQLDKSFLLD